MKLLHEAGVVAGSQQIIMFWPLTLRRITIAPHFAEDRAKQGRRIDHNHSYNHTASEKLYVPHCIDVLIFTGEMART
jgi:hypothetical protein